MEELKSDKFKIAEAMIVERLYHKYDVSRYDPKLAVEYLEAFLHIRSLDIHSVVILPQIADCAWHELILDTKRYRELCLELFEGQLAHVAADFNFLTRDYGSEKESKFEELNPTVLLSQSKFNEKGLRAAAQVRQISPAVQAR
ncbi:MAG: hypothetical protein ACJAVI_004186 [Candidatus Azotimanducaceae bacterium]|jgi:hypothetical protein